MSAPKHHYVPRYLLREFSIQNERRQVFVLDKATDRIFAASIDDVGCERNFNVLRESDGTEVVFESTFQRLDDIGAALIPRIIETRQPRSLAPNERFDLAKVLAAQLVRVKLYRDGLVQFTQELSDSLARAGSSQEKLRTVGF